MEEAGSGGIVLRMSKLLPSFALLLLRKAACEAFTASGAPPKMSRFAVVDFFDFSASALCAGGAFAGLPGCERLELLRIERHESCLPPPPPPLPAL